MNNIFFKKLIISNFKCFIDEHLEFNIPDGENEGSGLNIFIGENGNGKTAVLEAINYLTQSRYATENKLKISDFNNFEKDILIKGETKEFKCKMPYPGNYFECRGVEFGAKNRERKSPGRLLSSPFQIKNYFININNTYKNSQDEDSGNEIQDRFRIFNNADIINEEINIFYFDKNRTRQIITGNYTTTFERICDDLNWKFAKNLNAADDEKKKEITANICGDYFKNVIQIAQKGTGGKIATELKDFFNQDEYEDLNIELLDLLHPFSSAFFACRKNDTLKQIRARDLGSGIEMILTLLLLKSIANESKGSVIYLIDEPELHLHPKAQEQLLDLLIKESKTKQIFVSTHSPFIFKNSLSKNVGVLLFNRDQNNNIAISNAKDKDWGIFPWSPSWGEVNYYAYNLPTVEFHNELYGYLQERTGINHIDPFDDYLKEEKINTIKKYIQNGQKKDITLCTYIRNQIHHPENKDNEQYTDDELKASIEILINLAKKLRSDE